MISPLNANYSAKNTQPSFGVKLELSDEAAKYITHKMDEFMPQKKELPSFFTYHLKKIFERMTSNDEGVLKAVKYPGHDDIEFSFEPTGKMQEKVDALFPDLKKTLGYKQHKEYQWTLDDITSQLFKPFEKSLAETVALFHQRPWDKVVLKTDNNPILAVIAKAGNFIVDVTQKDNIKKGELDKIRRAMYRMHHLSDKYPAHREQLTTTMSGELQHTFAQLDQITKHRKDFAQAVQRIKEQLAGTFNLEVDKFGKLILPKGVILVEEGSKPNILSWF